MTAPPDATHLTSWEEAFQQYPIPTVRVLERQLQTELSANKEKLRGLVGESYRDLLRTAERIVEMDRDAQRVEGCLAEASRTCSAKLLERKARNLKMFEERVGAEDREKYVFAAQLAVLGSCPGVVGRLLQRDDGGENCLRATKVFVVMRLLLKSLLQKGPPTVPLLESLKNQRAALTTHLTTHIDHLLTTATPHLTTVLTSYSLLKTSPPSDVLRHFLFIRSSAISSLLTEHTPAATLAALTLYNQTLAHADALFPKRLSDTLVLLKSRPLLADPDLAAAVPDLALDTNARWLPDEIAGFVPWVRHDDLERARAVDLVGAWAERELLLVNEGLETALAGMDELGAIVELRAGVLALWRAGSRGRRAFTGGGGGGDDGAAASERFRELVGARVTAVLREKCRALAEVGVKIEEELRNDSGALEDSTSLWDPHLLTIPLTAGGALFKESVQSRVHGKNTAIKSFRTRYDAFLSSIASATNTLHTLRTAPTGTTPSTPGAPPEDDDDDFDAEEQRAQEALEDSLIAETELRTSLDASYRTLETHLETLLDASPTTPTHHHTFLLRTIRQIRQHPDPLLPLPWFGAALIPRLHGAAAAAVSRAPLDAMTHLLSQRKWSGTLASRALWEGAPPLPAQPSPLVFKFLHELVARMHVAGDDVWTPAAVRCVKGRACQELWAALERVLAGREIAAAAAGGEGEGETETETDSTRVIGMDWAVQLLFDALYLDEALQRKGANVRTSGISSLAGKIEAAIGIRLGFDEELRRRLEGGAREYWKRTCLLFGLLA